MAGGAAAALEGGAQHRIAQFEVERRAERFGLGRQPFVVDAVEAVGVDVALRALHVVDVCASIIMPRGLNMTL